MLGYFELLIRAERNLIERKVEELLNITEIMMACCRDKSAEYLSDTQIVFKIFEIAKRVNRADNLEILNAAIKDLFELKRIHNIH